MVHLFQLFLHQLLSGTAVSFNEYIYKYIRQKINQTPLAILNYNLSFELLEDTFVSNDINMMLNSFLNTFFRPSHGTFKGYIKWEAARGLLEG